MSQYSVTYESDIPGVESQVVATDLTFQEATQLSVELQGDAFNDDGHDLKDGQYAVQPQLSGVPHGR